MQIVHYLRNTLLALFLAHEFPMLFGLIFVEEMGVPLPLPGDTVIAYAGSIGGHSPFTAVAVVGVVALAAALGSSILYLVARHSGPAVIGRLQRFLHLHPERVVRMEAWFRARGAVAIVLGRLIPGLRTPTSIMAGLAKVPYRVFMPSTTLAAVLWSAFYYFVGDALRRAWSPFIEWAGDDPDQAVGIIVGTVLLLALLLWLHQRRSVPRAPQMDRAAPSHTATDPGASSPFI